MEYIVPENKIITLIDKYMDDSYPDLIDNGGVSESTTGIQYREYGSPNKGGMYTVEWTYYPTNRTSFLRLQDILFNRLIGLFGFDIIDKFFPKWFEMKSGLRVNKFIIPTNI
jgi:hypothetical protein